jgi:hypothetical protein
MRGMDTDSRWPKERNREMKAQGPWGEAGLEG